MSNPKKLLIAGAIFTGIATTYTIFHLLLPRPTVFGSISINDRNGQELLFLSENSERRQDVTLQDVPRSIIASTLIAEDQRFQTHHGIDWIASMRAVYDNVQAKSIVSGASTISQQVARNLLGINRPRSIINKCADMSLALVLEQTYSKEEILNFYLNHIFYGNHSYGIAAAAQTYFDTPLSKIDWNQASLLAAIPQNASYLNPYNNIQAVRSRQLTIADQLYDHHIITSDEYQTIQASPPYLTSPEQMLQAPHFGYFVLSEVEQRYGSKFWHDHTVKITTTLNRDWYRDSRRLLQLELGKLKDKNVHNAAIIALDNASGDILNYVGNTDYFDQDHSGAVDMVQALRQPGSALKPFIYLGTIMFSNLGTGSIFYDIPTSFLTAQNTPYTPLNYDLDYHGPVTMREALANSYNIPAVKALEKIGLTKGRQILQEAGITSLKEDNDHYGLSLALGSAELSLYELTNAYRTLANQGNYSETHSIISITIDGKTEQWTYHKSLKHPNWEAPSVLITNILQDKTARLAEFGENNALEFPYAVAAKTGTSRNFHDNWTLGYTPQVTVGVWVGNSDGQAMNQISGISGAGPIFHQVMNVVNNHQNKNFSDLPKPMTTTICLPSGLLPHKNCSHTSQERFLPDTAPQNIDTWYQADGLHLPPELHYWQEKFSTKSTGGLSIISPHDQDVFKLDLETPIGSQSIKCSIHAPDITNLTINLNGKVISNNTTCTLPFKPGSYSLQASGELPDGKRVSDTVRFFVE